MSDLTGFYRDARKISCTVVFNAINNYNFDDKTIFMKVVSSIIHREGYYRNSQHVYRDLTIVLDQSELLTQLCHVRIKKPANSISCNSKECVKDTP